MCYCLDVMARKDGKDMAEPKLLSLPEAAESLGLSYENTLRWVQRGRLKATKIGRDYVVTETDLGEFRSWWEANPRVQAVKGQ